MTALMTAVGTKTSGVARLYPLNGVPASPTYPYGVYSVALGRGDAYSAAAEFGVRHGGVVVQTFGKTLDSATSHMELIVTALLDVRLTSTCTPLVAALDQPAVNRDPDDNGVVTVTLPFTFAKEA